MRLIDNQSQSYQKANLKYDILSLNGLKYDSTVNFKEITLDNDTGFTIEITDRLRWDNIAEVIISNDEILKYTDGKYPCKILIPGNDLMKCIFESGYMNNRVLSGKFLLTKINLRGKNQVSLVLNNLNENIGESKKISEALATNKTGWKNWIPGHKYQINYNKQVLFLGTLPFNFTENYATYTRVIPESYNLYYAEFRRRDEKIPIFINLGGYYYLQYISKYSTTSGNNIDLVSQILNDKQLRPEYVFEATKSVKGVDMGEMIPNEAEDLDYLFSSYCLGYAKSNNAPEYLFRVGKAYLDEDAKTLFMSRVKSVIKNMMAHSDMYYKNGYSTHCTDYPKLTSEQLYNEFKINLYYGEGAGYLRVYVNGLLFDKPEKDEAVKFIEEARK
jgi:hypothetical protein